MRHVSLTRFIFWVGGWKTRLTNLFFDLGSAYPVLRFGGPQKHLKEIPIDDCKNEMPGSFSFIQEPWQLHILFGSFQIDFDYFEQCILPHIGTLPFCGFWYIVI